MASLLIVLALQKGPCVANQIVYIDIGSADNLVEQGLDLRNTANKPLSYWLLPNLTTTTLKASSRPDAIIFFTKYCVHFSGHHPQLRFSAAC
jgi:hypothetical protein